MLELYQFQHSSFCLKVRLGLEAKKLTYRIVEIKPGIGQLQIFKLSGQKQLPVLKDGENVISDSTAIIEYLEKITKEPSLVPKDPKEAAIVEMIEDWADTALAKSVRLELIKAASMDPLLREALLPESFPGSLKNLVNTLPFELINGVNEIINTNQSQQLLDSLKKISKSVSVNQYLVGNSLTIADLAVAAQLSLLCFPFSSGKRLYHKGCPGFADNPQLKDLFDWRDELEEKLFEKDPATL